MLTKYEISYTINGENENSYFGGGDSIENQQREIRGHIGEKRVDYGTGGKASRY